MLLRGMREKASEGRQATATGLLDGLRELLAVKDYAKPEPVITWKGTEQLAVSDIDFHGEYKPGPHTVETLAALCQPRPVAWWRTHGGGLRAVFVEDGPYNADELAAVFCFTCRQREPMLSGAEVKSETRHPEYPRADGSRAGPIHWQTGNTDLSGLSELIANAYIAREDDIADWLTANGFQLHKAYEHDKCLINPGHPSHGKPVWVGDTGITCRSCDAAGIVFTGCNKPGLIPYAVLLDRDQCNRLNNNLRSAVRHFCHWQHAKHIISNLADITGKAAERLYRALLKLVHLPKAESEVHKAGILKLIDRVFFPAIPMVRADDVWVHDDNLAIPYKPETVAEYVAHLPAVHYVDKVKGTLERNRLDLKPARFLACSGGFFGK